MGGFEVAEADLGLTLQAWYGVRVFTDGVGPGATPEDTDLERCVEAEEEAGHRDPYRRLASQLHVVALRAQGCTGRRRRAAGG